MKTTVRVWLASVMLTAGASFGGETDVDRLEALVAQWVRLRAETAEEKRVWREQKDQLNEEIALLEKEKADLVRALDQARETSSEADAARARLRSRRNELQDAQDALLQPGTQVELLGPPVARTC